jgi:hypothetical protein
MTLTILAISATTVGAMAIFFIVEMTLLQQNAKISADMVNDEVNPEM